MHDNFELFKGKKYSDLLKDIYHNSKRKDRQINALIAELQPLMKSMGDATVIVPLIKEYLEISVKNDDHLVKLAAIVQRLMGSTSSSTDDSGYDMTEEEKRHLLEEAEEEILKIKEVQVADETNDI